jgi:uncharacterized protein (TIGR02266 family)
VLDMTGHRSSPGFASRSGRAHLEIAIDCEMRGESFVATSMNIGIGGLFVATNRRFELGERINLRFRLPGQSHAIAVTGEVKWLRQVEGRTLGIGLRFMGLTILAAAAIQEFLCKMSDDESPSDAA